MAEISKANPDFVIWHAGAHAGEGPFPNSRETLFTEAITTLEDQLDRARYSSAYWRDAATKNAERVIRYRRQRNGLVVIIASIAVNSYLEARKRHEAERVNPPEGT